ncbi:MAG: hypothetical protein ACTSQU_03730 [Promethearchaeota archaeon]
MNDYSIIYRQLSVKLIVNAFDRLFGISLFVVTEKEIRRRLMMGLMRGSGTESDPYIFTDLSSLPTRILFSGVKSRILVDGGTFDYIGIRWCRNVQIRNSKVVTITMKHSTDITVENTVFLALNLKRSKGNVYRNNECSPAVKITFEKKQKLFPLGDVIELIMFCTLIGMFLFVMFLILFSPLFPLGDVIELIMFFLVIVVIISFMGFSFIRQKLRMIRNYLLIRNRVDIIENNQYTSKSDP